MSVPEVTAGALVCLACHHWQIDIPPRARRDLGGARAALVVVSEEYAAHLAGCVGAGGRIKIQGHWVDRPAMSDGRPADGTLGMVPFPRWWVTK